MEAFHEKPILRKLARTSLWIIPAFTLPFFVIAIAVSGYFWPLVAIVYSSFIVGLGYCDTHLPESRTAAINQASPGRRLQFAMGFYALQIFVAPITLILIGGLMYLGLTLVSKISGMNLF
jgi:hypothetical protein